MTSVNRIDLKVALIDSDYYTEKAIHAYLAWDRRTRVICKTARLADFWEAIDTQRLKYDPDVVIIDASQLDGAAHLTEAIERLRERFKDVMVICLAPFPDLDDLYAATDAGAKAYLLKPDTRIHIAWAICHAYCLKCLKDDGILISAGVVNEACKLRHGRLNPVKQLAKPRNYVGLTPRIRQAIELFAIEGLSHSLVANEMGITVNAVRGYVKTAYRILESYRDDASEYRDLSPQEQAFMRITALDIPDC